MTRTFVLILSFCLALCGQSWAQGSEARQFHVATAGSDANPGTREKPFATLSAARDAIRRLKARGAEDAGRGDLRLRIFADGQQIATADALQRLTASLPPLP